MNITHGKRTHCLYSMCIHVTCSYSSNSPERKFVPSVSASSVPSVSESPSTMEMRLSQQQHSPHLSPSGHTPTLSSSPSQQPLCHSATISSGLKWVSHLCHRGKLQVVVYKMCLTCLYEKQSCIQTFYDAVCCSFANLISHICHTTFPMV